MQIWLINPNWKLPIGFLQRIRNGVQQSQATLRKNGFWESENMQHYARFEAIGALHMEVIVFSWVVHTLPVD